MAQKRKQAESKGKNRKNSAPKRSASKKTEKQQRIEEPRPRNYRVEAILYAAAALIFLFVIVIKGASVWSFIRGVFFGFFGICSILVPLTFAYLTVITALEKVINRFKTKVVMCAAIVMLAETAVYLISDYHFEHSNYFVALGKLFGRGFSSESYFTTGGGLFSGILGYPLLHWFGKAAAIAVVLVLLVALILISFIPEISLWLPKLTGSL